MTFSDFPLTAFDPMAWPLPPNTLTLPEGTVHLWAASLDLPHNRLERYARLLSEDERAQAARYHFDRDRYRYIAGRGQLRVLLGRYLGVEPRDLRFGYSRYGKPSLASPTRQPLFHFNLSHSQQFALYAFAWGHEMGIDIEYKRDLPDLMEIATRFFSPSEYEVLARLAVEEQADAFFRCWTRKEAYLKASGEGLSRPLDAFDVPLAPGEPPRLLRVADSPDEVHRWTMHELPMPPDYAATLCVEGALAVQGWRLE